MRAKWIGETGNYFTNGTEYDFRSEDSDYVVTTDDEKDDHSWSRDSFPGKEWVVVSGDFAYAPDEGDVAFLKDLAERLMHVPVMYGTDQDDSERLIDIANRLN